MGLQSKKSIKKYIPRIIFILVIVVLLLCALKISLWEKKYYAEKEGSERAVAVVGDVDTTETPSEEEVTEKQRAEYTVSADKPRYLNIDKLGIKNARVIEVGVDAKGQMQTPNSIYDAGWYIGSKLPNQGGTTVIDGHNGANQKGIFKELNTLVAGDILSIEMGDGSIYNYRVYDNVQIELKKANQYLTDMMTSPVQGQESVTIITCSGEYSLTQKTYLSRQFVRATRV
jgi:LPXTG-site transpeptidase (sortase) family protein